MAVLVNSRARAPFVPFPRLSAIIGYGVLSSILVLTVLEGVCWIVYRAKAHNARHAELKALTEISGPVHCRGTSECPNALWFASASPAVDGQVWADDVFRELLAVQQKGNPPTPYLEWSSQVIHTRYLNVDQTPLGPVRRTVPSPPGCTNPIQVWMFGGSEMWGWGAPDELTVPSYVEKRLSEAGVCAEVTNLGVLGYNSTQELIRLSLLLAQDHRPHIAVFLDGFNDAENALTEADFRWPMLYTARQSEQASLGGVLARTSLGKASIALSRRLHLIAQAQSASHKTAVEMAQASRGAVDYYLAYCRIITDLGRANGFRAFFFWQPTVDYGPKPLSAFERGLVSAQRSGSEFSYTGIRDVYREAHERFRGVEGIEELTDIFQSTPATMYLDIVHTGPEGNRMIASKIADALLRANIAKHPPI